MKIPLLPEMKPLPVCAFVHMPITVSQLAETFIAAEKLAGVNSARLALLPSEIAPLVQAIGNMPVSAVNSSHIQRLLDGLRPYQAKRRLNIYRALFFHGGKNLLGNVCITDAPKIHLPIYTVEELVDLLRKLDPVQRSIVMIAAYLGVRKSELMTCNAHAGEEVAVESAGRYRLVPINAALRQWLESLKQVGQPQINNPRTVGALARKLKSIGSDAAFTRLRLSYIAYRLAQTRNAQLVAHEVGVAIQSSFHRPAVSAEDAERYFSIRPDSLLS